jgi:hypothetical protein
MFYKISRVLRLKQLIHPADILCFRPFISKEKSLDIKHSCKEYSYFDDHKELSKHYFIEKFAGSGGHVKKATGKVHPCDP